MPPILEVIEQHSALVQAIAAAVIAVLTFVLIGVTWMYTRYMAKIAELQMLEVASRVEPQVDVVLSGIERRGEEFTGHLNIISEDAPAIIEAGLLLVECQHGELGAYVSLEESAGNLIPKGGGVVFSVGGVLSHHEDPLQCVPTVSGSVEYRDTRGLFRYSLNVERGHARRRFVYSVKGPGWFPRHWGNMAWRLWGKRRAVKRVAEHIAARKGSR